MPRIKLIEPEATYLMWLDCTALGISGDVLADFIINDCLVAVSRGDSFGDEGFTQAGMQVYVVMQSSRESINGLKGELAALFDKQQEAVQILSKQNSMA